MATTAQRALTMNDTENEIEGGLAEVELQKLQRQYRMMESDRKAYSEESRILIAKQRNNLEKLLRENQMLEEELKLLQLQIDDGRKNGPNSKRADGLKEQADIYQVKIREATQELRDLDQRVAEMERAIGTQRSVLGSVSHQSPAAIEKQIHVLENRLDKALVKYNKSLAQNKKLRAQIDNLRRERSMFDNVYRKFEREMSEQKKFMAEIIEASNSAYEARDEAQAKIFALKDKSEKEHQSYLQELKELDRQLEQDRKLREFMAIKSSERTENPFFRRHNLENANKGSQDLAVESVESYEKGFNKIKEVTNCQNYNELVKRFSQVEDQNFSLFNYVNEVNNQIETLAEEIAEIENQMNRTKSQNADIENKRQDELRKQEESLSSLQSKTEQYEKQYETIAELLNCSYEHADKLLAVLQKAGMVRPASASVNGQANAIEDGLKQPSSSETQQPSATTSNNVIRRMSWIEERVNELLMRNLLLSLPKKFTTAAVTSSDKKEGDTANAGSAQDKGAADGKDPAALAAMLQALVASNNAGELQLSALLGTMPAAPVGHVSIQPPSTADDRDTDDADSEEDDRPLTRNELRLKTLRSIARREKQAQAANDDGLGMQYATINSRTSGIRNGRRRGQR